jgi:mannose-6-phosphate isomerase-like protein (cupin superfamily)
MSYHSNVFCMLIQALVLCGGSGSRGCSLPRQQYPKLLPKLADSDAIFQAILQQVNGLAAITPGALQAIGGGSDPVLPVIRSTGSCSTGRPLGRAQLASSSAYSKNRNPKWQSATCKKARTFGRSVCGCATVRYVSSRYSRYGHVGMGACVQVKRIVVTPGDSLLSQMYHQRVKYWIVVHGDEKIAMGEDDIVLFDDVYDCVLP